jgi:hypothetical protein
MTVHGDGLSGAVRDLELRRALALEGSCEELEEVDELSVFELRK